MKKKRNNKKNKLIAQWKSYLVEVHKAQLASNVRLGREHLDNEDKDRFNCENNI